MRSVVTFWQLPEDEKDFLAFLLTTGNIVAVPSHWVKKREEITPQPIVSYIEKHDPIQLAFGLERYALQAVEAQVFEGEVLFGVTIMTACLIGYSRGRFRDGNKLTQSNLVAYWDYPSADSTELIAKDPEFVTWAKKVFSWVRKFAPRQVEYNGRPCRATRRVKDAVQKGQIELVPY
jgi:hypothetical protein